VNTSRTRILHLTGPTVATSKANVSQPAFTTVDRRSNNYRHTPGSTFAVRYLSPKTPTQRDIQLRGKVGRVPAYFPPRTGLRVARSGCCHRSLPARNSPLPHYAPSPFAAAMRTRSASLSALPSHRTCLSSGRPRSTCACQCQPRHSCVHEWSVDRVARDFVSRDRLVRQYIDVPIHVCTLPYQHAHVAPHGATHSGRQRWFPFPGFPVQLQTSNSARKNQFLSHL
jgi:hypothetical protein